MFLKNKKNSNFSNKDEGLTNKQKRSHVMDVINNEISVEKATLNENVKQYLLNSTLHGLRYVGDTKISLFERLFFGLAFIFVFTLSSYFISNIWDKWSASPIIIAINSVSTSISDIPFPAVTICNMNQAKESVVRNITEGTFEDTLLQSLCLKNVNFTSTKSKYAASWSKFRSFLIRVSQPCKEMLVICKYATGEGSCMKLFNTVLTDEGLCCIFNRVHPMYLLQSYNDSNEFDLNDESYEIKPVDWTPENGYGDSNKKRIYPRPGSGAGSHMGLSVVLNASVNDYHCSSTNSAGFKVLLHNPTETPKIADFGFSVSPGHESRIIVTPKIADASSLIRKVPYKLRQCVFANEGNLTYFRTYSRKNCEMECESRLIEEVCGCVLYYMPRIKEDTNICSRDDWKCYEKIKLAIELATNDTYQCSSCLPGCFEISYGADLSYAKIGVNGFAMRMNRISKMEMTDVQSSIAVVHIYYAENSFRSNSKEELIGFTEFLSNTGGLLGLFMGFSVVSIIEIIYFVSLRPLCARKNILKLQQTTSKSRTTTTYTGVNPIIINRKKLPTNTWHETSFKNNKQFIKQKKSSSDDQLRLPIRHINATWDIEYHNSKRFSYVE